MSSLRISEKFKDVFFSVFYFVGKDLKSSKSLDIENNLHHKFSYDLHNISFFLILGFAALYFFDLLLLDATGIRFFMKSMEFFPLSTEQILNNKIKYLYLSSFIFSSVVALVGALVFYIRNKNKIYKSEILNIHLINNSVSGVAQFLGGIPIWVLFFIGGYLTVVRIPEVLGVSTFSIVQVFLVFLVVKISALMCGSSGSMLISLFPYKK